MRSLPLVLANSLLLYAGSAPAAAGPEATMEASAGRDGSSSEGADDAPSPSVPLDAPSLPAEGDASASEPPAVDVVVTGSRTHESRKSSVMATQVIGSAEMRQTGATTLDGVLEAQPGLQIERTFRGSELWFRGLDPEYTLILVDGQRVPGRVGGAVDLGRYSLEAVERVEIVRGPSSALYGSDAIGGVVNLITRESHHELEAEAEGRIFTQDALAFSGRVSGRPAEALGISLSAGHQRRAPFRRDPDSTATTGSGLRLDTAGATLTVGRVNQGRVRLSADYSRTRLDGVDEGAGRAIFDRTQLQEQATLRASYDKRSQTLSLQSGASYSQFREQYLTDQRGSVALDSYQDNREHQGLLHTVVSSTWDRSHRTTVGGEILGQILDSQRLRSRGTRTRYSAFAEHRVALYAEDRELIAVVLGARADIDSQFGSQLSPKLAFKWDPWDFLTVRAGYGRGFRAPSFQELLLRFENAAVGYVVSGNPDLRAESSHSVDLGMEYRPHRDWLASVTLFRNDLSDMITTELAGTSSDSGTLFSYQNAANARTQGIESQVNWAPSSFFRSSVGYTLTETWNSELERPLTGRPLHRFFARSSVVVPGIELDLSGRATLSLERKFYEELADGSTHTITAEPLLQIDLRMSRAFSDEFELFAGVNNVAEAGDAYAALLPRQFYVGLRGSY
ncbi:MAG: hypothetical protein B6A08_12045 [Sorangiineae bacterium NIC37A_2]|jgi:outer membrane receptor for ferrienterochelin and colicins|nr:MAG: hypothetical protein B6A08_12045 [Sorangiineae bacterium NIC37A_2]